MDAISGIGCRVREPIPKNYEVERWPPLSRENRRGGTSREYLVSASRSSKRCSGCSGPGRISRRGHGGGPRAPLLQDPERALLRSAVAKQPDVTLAELQGLLAAHGSRTVSEPTICRALQQLKLPRKKKVAAPPSGKLRLTGRSSASS